MKPVTPVVPGYNLPVTTYAKDQPEYIPLPVFLDSDGTVTSRWRMSLRERLRVLVSGDIYLMVMTFHKPLQPVMLTTKRPVIGMSRLPESNNGDAA